MSLLSRDQIFYETFSFAGKQSLRKYNVKLNPKKKFKNMLLMNNSLNQGKNEDYLMKNKLNLKLYKFYKEESEKNSIFNKTYQKKIKKLFEGEKYKYHKKSLKKLVYERNKKNQMISPKLIFDSNSKDINYISPRKIKFVLNWKKITGRKLITDKEKEQMNLSVLNIKKDNYSHIGFVDMSKQTERNNNFLYNDLRNRNGNKFIPLDLKLEKEKWKKFIEKPLIPKSPFSSDFENRIYQRLNPSSQIKKAKRHKSPNIIHMKKDIYALQNKSIIDFHKSTGREDLFSNIKKMDDTAKTILHPNYNSIEERVKMMVVYKKKKENKYTKKNELKNIYVDDHYSTIKSFENIYGHKLQSVPNFKQMMSRPYDDKLPVFMIGIYNRMNDFNLNSTENNYSDKDIHEEKINYKNMINKLSKKEKHQKVKEKSEIIYDKFIKLYADFYHKLKKNRAQKNKLLKD